MLVNCDFCAGPAFQPEAWNQRTCHRCAAAGAPDQSKVGWEAYQRLAADYARARGVRPPLSPPALAMREGQTGVESRFQKKPA